jgi:GTP pyrophosphokinase
MYQSLHTTVITKSGEPFEIQIRTWEMHNHDEVGIAAHWKYKEGKNLDKDYEAKIAWLRQMLDWQKEVRSSKEFVERVRVDLFSEVVLVFTPKGEVIELPQGATPVDFAFKVHTNVGYNCVGARVNGIMVPLSTELKTGDRVEIITSKNPSGPKLDWLKFVKSASARSRIKAYFRKLYEEQKKHEAAVEKQAPAVQAPVPQVKKKAQEEFIPVIDGAAYGVKTSVAKCCNPTYPDNIVGYVSRGRGIKIHRVDCSNLQDIIERGGKVVPAHWLSSSNRTQFAFFRITVWDTPGLIYKIAGIFANLNLSFENFHSSTRTEKKYKGHYQAYMRFSCRVTSKTPVNEIVKAIEEIPEVLKVRVTKRWIYEGSSPESEESGSIS